MSKQSIEDRFSSLRNVYAPGNVSEPVESPAPEPTAPEPQVAPHIVLRNADAALDVARHNLRLARTNLASARETVGKCLAAYNQQTPTMTPEQNVRQHLAHNQAERARRAAAGAPYQPNVTQTAKAMAGGGYGNDMRARRGGGAAFRRGAFSKAQAATINAQQIRAARAEEAARMAGSNAPLVK